MRLLWDSCSNDCVMLACREERDDCQPLATDFQVVSVKASGSFLKLHIKRWRLFGPCKTY